MAHGPLAERRRATKFLYRKIVILTFQTVDTTPPVIACINDVTTTTTAGSTGTTVTWTEPTATDNSGVVSLTGRTHQPGTFFNIGTTQVTYTFTDGSGNSATCTFNVNVVSGMLGTLASLEIAIYGSWSSCIRYQVVSKSVPLLQLLG